MKHQAKHPLPISNGYGTRGDFSSVTVRCGRCKDCFEPDLDWVERLIAYERREVERQLERGYFSPGQGLDAHANIDREEQRLRAFVCRT